MKAYVRLLWLVLAVVVAAPLSAWSGIPLRSDRSVFMPGSQPGTFALEPSTRCGNCHGAYDTAIEPLHNWQGSMMAQASRDPLWLAAMVAAEQDAIWLLGSPNAGSLCLRCHVPTGWIASRAEPVNMTGFAASDFDGVSCALCHRMTDPLHGRQPDVPEDPAGSKAAVEANRTWTADTAALGRLKLFDQSPFVDSVTGLPRFFGNDFATSYAEATSGQFAIDETNFMRGPRADVFPMHSWYYSRFHRSRTFCGTCHDVSNAPMAWQTGGTATPETVSAGSYFHLERTWSEFSSSAFGRSGAVILDDKGSRTVSRCQDCHMPSVVGASTLMPGVVRRNDLALHDFSGGNAWVLGILASADRSAPLFDATNYAILSGEKYPAAKIDVAGLEGAGAALLAGRSRALGQLARAATMRVLSSDNSTLRIAIYNNTGHKLISGFPEGRRMWLNVKFFSPAGAAVGEVNPYEPLVVEKEASGALRYVSGGDLKRTDDALVYEAKMASSHTQERATFHFLLVTGRTKDNRIPPRGFDTAAAAPRLALPRVDGVDAPDLFTAAEYAGGYDEVSVAMPQGATRWTATLYYQTTSKEYVEFLRDEIEGTASTLRMPAPSGVPGAYVVQSDPFFATLRDWGRAIWQLWLHNGGAPPIAMATVSSSPPGRHRAVRR